LKVLLIDDHVMFREGMGLLLSDLDEGLEFLHAGTLEEGIISLKDNDVDLILLDLKLPDSNGITALREVREEFSSIPLAVVSGTDDPAQIRELIDEGAAGFVPKSSSSEVLLAALKLIIAGGVYLPPAALDFVPVPRLEMTDAETGAALLSSRQTAVLLKAIQGKPNKIIAQELDIAEGTVKAHLSSAYRALGVHNRTEAVFAAAKLGLHPHPFEQD
jgi:DNA-binding NarL/FixJ family response regulator